MGLTSVPRPLSCTAPTERASRPLGDPHSVSECQQIIAVQLELLDGVMELVGRQAALRWLRAMALGSSPLLLASLIPRLAMGARLVVLSRRCSKAIPPRCWHFSGPHPGDIVMLMLWATKPDIFQIRTSRLSRLPSASYLVGGAHLECNLLPSHNYSSFPSSFLGLVA